MGQVDLAAILADAVAANATLLNATGQRWPDRPLTLTLSWHPKMQKLDLVVKTVHHLPVYRPESQ